MADSNINSMNSEGNPSGDMQPGGGNMNNQQGGSNQQPTEELLRQSPFGVLLDLPGVDGVEDIFGNVGGMGGENPFGGSGQNTGGSGQNTGGSGQNPGGGNPFAGENFWNIFAGGVNPSELSGGGNQGGFGGGNQGGFGGGNQGGFGGGNQGGFGGGNQGGFGGGNQGGFGGGNQGGFGGGNQGGFGGGNQGGFGGGNSSASADSSNGNGDSVIPQSTSDTATQNSANSNFAEFGNLISGGDSQQVSFDEDFLTNFQQNMTKATETVNELNEWIENNGGIKFPQAFSDAMSNFANTQIENLNNLSSQFSSIGSGDLTSQFPDIISNISSMQNTFEQFGNLFENSQSTDTASLA